MFNSGLLTGPQVFPFFQKSDIAHDTLACIWELADIGKDAKLDVRVCERGLTFVHLIGILARNLLNSNLQTIPVIAYVSAGDSLLFYLEARRGLCFSMHSIDQSHN